MRNGVVPEHWTNFYESTHIPAAVRDGDRLYVTGHTGEDPPKLSPHRCHPVKGRCELGRCGGTQLVSRWASGSGRNPYRHRRRVPK